MGFSIKGSSEGDSVRDPAKKNEDPASSKDDRQRESKKKVLSIFGLAVFLSIGILIKTLALGAISVSKPKTKVWERGETRLMDYPTDAPPDGSIVSGNKRGASIQLFNPFSSKRPL